MPEVPVFPMPEVVAACDPVSNAACDLANESDHSGLLNGPGLDDLAGLDGLDDPTGPLDGPENLTVKVRIGYGTN